MTRVGRRWDRAFCRLHALGALLATAVACGGVENDPRGATGSTTGAGGAGGSTLAGQALAVRQTDLPVAYDRQSFPYPDPDTLYIGLGEAQPQCETPWAVLDCTSWAIGFQLPPAMQKPGTYALGELPGLLVSDPQPDVTDPSQCVHGGGTVTGGTVEVLSIDDDGVRLVVRDVVPKGAVAYEPNGEFVAGRCFAGLSKEPLAGTCGAPTACASDLDCTTGGCGHEQCFNPAESAGSCDASCSSAPASMASCGCVAGTCAWWWWQ